LRALSLKYRKGDRRLEPNGGGKTRLVPDAVLGDRETMLKVKELSREFLLPRFRAGSEPVGRVREVNVCFLAPDIHYYRREGLLSLIDRNSFSYYLRAISTRYFTGKMRSYGRKPRRSRKMPKFFFALLMVHRYRNLYRSIRRHGMVSDASDPSSVPWLVASRKCYYRLDGHHRASIARHLGIDRMQALVITPKDLLTLPDLPDRFRAFLSGLHEPPADLLPRPDVRPSDPGGGEG
jgi:hypothetical protein